jgi:hypothetical protein
MKIIPLIFLLICGCSQKFTALEAATDALLIADWSQTRQIPRSPDQGWYETNIYLGEHPGDGRVNGYFATCLVVNTVIHRVLPEPYLRYYQTGVVAVEAIAIGNNYNLGIKVKF